MIREIEPITNKELDQLVAEGLSEDTHLVTIYGNIKDEYLSDIEELCEEMEMRTGDEDGVDDIDPRTADLIKIPLNHPEREELEDCQAKIAQCREYLDLIETHQNKHYDTWLKTFFSGVKT